MHVRPTSGVGPGVGQLTQPVLVRSGTSRPSAAHASSEAQNVQVGVPAAPNHEECLYPRSRPFAAATDTTAQRARAGEQKPQPGRGRCIYGGASRLHLYMARRRSLRQVYLTERGLSTGWRSQAQDEVSMTKKRMRVIRRSTLPASLDPCPKESHG
jgi:hypothetical protein